MCEVNIVLSFRGAQVTLMSAVRKQILLETIQSLNKTVSVDSIGDSGLLENLLQFVPTELSQEIQGYVLCDKTVSVASELG